MTTWARTHWLSYFYTGAMIVFASWALTNLTGCRFGNRVESQTSNDPLTGYYESQPQTLTFCAVGNSLHETCKDAAASGIPSEISQVMTNPLGFKVLDLTTGSAALVAVDPTGRQLGPAFPVSVGSAPDYPIGLSGDWPAQTLFLDSACQLTSHLDIDGFAHLGAQTVLASTLTRSGRIEAKFTVTQAITGNCGPSLQQMHDCYLDVNACGGANAASNQKNQSLVNATFDVYIQANAMTAADIPTAAKLSYEASYQ